MVNAVRNYDEQINNQLFVNSDNKCQMKKVHTKETKKNIEELM